MVILDGREIADYIKQRHYQQVRRLKVRPTLVIVQVGEDEATAKYIRQKQKYGEDTGVAVEHHQVAAGELAELIKKLNQNTAVTGIIVQLPLPDESVLEQIDPSKDVDGLRSDSKFEPATAKGILWLLSSYQIETKDQTVAVVGQGQLVGEPVSRLLEQNGLQVIRCDIDTPDLKKQTLKADIVISATGQKHLIKPGMVKQGAVVIDAGSPEPEVDPRLREDDSLKISPVPGGVGPMTVASLFDNLLIAAVD